MAEVSLFGNCTLVALISNAVFIPGLSPESELQERDAHGSRHMYPATYPRSSAPNYVDA